MIDDAIVHYVRVEASFHNLDYAAVRRLESLRPGKMSGSSIEVNTAIFAGSITKFFDDHLKTTLLDTPDHFDYDSACTMILNLE